MIDSVALIPGHGARYDKKTGAPVWDPGACHVFGATKDQNELSVQETDYVRWVAAWVASSAKKMPVTIHDAPGRAVLRDADHPLRGYTNRSKAALKAALTHGPNVLVLHLHFNAGGGDYGMAVADAGSPPCMQFAKHVSADLADWGRPHLSDFRAVTHQGLPAGSKNLLDSTWTAGRLYPKAKVYALVLEFCFVDRDDHRPLLEEAGIARLGRALGASLDRLVP